MPNIIPIPQQTFQAPGFVQPKTFDQLPKSIDALFTAYQQGQLERAQLEAATAQARGAQFQNQAAQANFAIANQGLTPQDINQNIGAAMQPGPNPNSFYATPVQQPGSQILGAQPQPQQQMPWMGNQGQPVPQEDPKITTLRNIMQMHLQGAQLGAAKQGAELQKTQAESAKLGAEAGLTQAQVDLMGGSSAAVDNLYNRIVGGQATTDDLSNLGRGEVANALKIGVMTKLAANGIDINKLNREAAAKKAGLESSTRLTEGGSSQELSRAANAAYKQFDLLQKASDETVRFNNQWANKAFLEIAKVADPATAKLMAALSNARIEWARAASGSKSPSDTFMEEAKTALPATITPAQLPGVIEQLKHGLAETVQGQLTPATLDDAKARQQPSNGLMERTGKLPGESKSVPLVSMDGGKTWHKK